MIDETPLSYEGDKLVLTIPKSYAGLDGERLRRRFESLAMLVEKVPEIRIVPVSNHCLRPAAAIFLAKLR